MLPVRSHRDTSSREGVVLLVVISLLVLFALVGIAFVIYAEAQANTARIWREGETLQNPDIDPELLLAYFLGQFLYDTDNQFSALRGHSLARNMYGRPASITPFSGTGRIHTDADPALDDYYQVDYTAYGGLPGRNPDQFGSPNAPYTYPDFNNLYLAAVRGSDGQVLIPSYVRFGPGGTRIALRPRMDYHNPTNDPKGFPAVGPGGDVKNLAESPGYGAGPNDSIWLDLGFPVMIAADGRKFKPLFAPLVTDLDNRLNANVHGNIRAGNTYPPRASFAGGDQVFGPWEVNLQSVLKASDKNFDYDPNDGGLYPEARRLFTGRYAWHPDGVKGRLQHRPEVDAEFGFRGLPAPPGSFWGDLSQRLPAQYRINGNFHVGSGGWDASPAGIHTYLPGFLNTPPNSAFPYFDHSGNDADIFVGSNHSNHPMMFNFFMPDLNYYMPNARDRSFRAFNMEGLLRYGDTGSPALTNELFFLCPLSFADPQARRLITTLSFDLDRPGAMPWLWAAPGVGPYVMAPGASYPTAGPVPLPPSGTSPTGSDFTPQWQSILAMLGRINLNRDLPWGAFPAYPMINNGRMTDAAQFDRAVQARVQMARELFKALRALTGIKPPVWPTIEFPPPPPRPPSMDAPDINALRWLAQLAVNIVDFIDRDDFVTPFDWTSEFTDYRVGETRLYNWTESEFVYGTEMPRLILNEAYAEAANDPTDPKTGGKAEKDYKVNFWVELYNPWFPEPYNNNGYRSYNGSMDGVLPNIPPDFVANAAHPVNGDGHRARLQIPADGAKPAYAAYQVVIANPVNTRLRNVDNVRGEPDANSVKLVVSDYTADPTAPPPDPAVDQSLVLPKGGFNGGSNGDLTEANLGWYLLGPAIEFPGSDRDRPKATLRLKDNGLATGPTRSGLSYELPKDSDLAALPRHTILLRRLCCPHMPPQPNPTQPFYNPYITVDYLEEVPTHDGVDADPLGTHMTQTVMEERFSVGRNQPYAAHRSQQIEQRPRTANRRQPQHTFFKTNVQVIDPNTGRSGNDPPDLAWPYDWLVVLDRQLISPIEITQVSAFKPHELTQQFMRRLDAATGKPLGKFRHLAPWYDPNARLYRLFEFLAARSALQWEPAGGRIVGKINLNTVWDKELWDAMASTNIGQFYTQAFLDDCWTQMMAQRSPAGVPALGDRPFKGFATPYALAGDLQYPDGIGIEDTFLAPDRRDPSKRLFEPANVAAMLRTEANNHPFIKSWFLRKICAHCTTRSNVFAVYLTVGFFEVLDDSDPNKPPRLGAEIGRSENRHKRHRMLAIVDRTNVTVGFDPATGNPIAGEHGPRPFFIPSHTAVPGPGQYDIEVPRINGTYEGFPWAVKKDDYLVVDSGLNQEIIQVLGVNAAPPTITARFTKPHASRFALSNAMLGNPGPQPRFDMRDPAYQGVIRYFCLLD